MSDILTQDAFPVENPNAVSVRIFFAKESEVATVWHLCDAKVCREDHGRVMTIALHGSFIYAAVQCDTTLQANLRRKEGDQFCMRCLEEFEIAKEIIERRKLLKFK